ncbi:dephospho-CoA kinase [uncultured Eudoraea sp.]|uniref:dephospho-CoA kinase n=1 Tax=uncultured Eudoraea sp. TaxID=1035614 RepID=UPI00260CB811|nr:dephospho-CoA kinase [uncultured Eudoraea sp.]
MKIIGLTGGIGSGKTTVAKLFKELGVPVYNSDLRAKKLMNNSKGIRTAVIDLLGKDSYELERLNKKYIADKVFSNKELLQKLNSIVHPAVRKDFSRWVKKKKTLYVIQEAAILFENNAYSNFDKIILVKAPKEVRLERIIARDNGSKEEILARMENQWDDSKKIPLSDYIIENIDLDKTKLQVEQIHRQLIKTAV